MTTTRPLFVLFVIAFFSFSNISFGQKPHIVTLHVDTDNLDAHNAASDSISTFTAIDTQIEKASPPEAFTIVVEKGSTIVWEAVSSSSSEDTVEVIMIRREKGPRIFGSDEINGIGNGKAQAQIIKNTLIRPYKYKILFKVNGADQVYEIDPKIKVGS